MIYVLTLMLVFAAEPPVLLVARDPANLQRTAEFATEVECKAYAESIAADTQALIERLNASDHEVVESRTACEQRDPAK